MKLPFQFVIASPQSAGALRDLFKIHVPGPFRCLVPGSLHYASLPCMEPSGIAMAAALMKP